MKEILMIIQMKEIRIICFWEFLIVLWLFL